MSHLEDRRCVRRGQTGCFGLLHSANHLTKRAAAGEQLADERVERVSGG